MTTTQTHLFRFTPSMMPPETLEQLLVQRQTLAQRLTDVIRESVTTQNKHHRLLVGPRGMGKTHLVALTYYRVKAMDDLRENLWIAWLNEEEWGVDSFLDLLLRICRALQAEYPSLFPSERMEALYQMTQAEAQRAAELLLKEFIGDRTLVLLMENLDELFKGIGDNGQRQFRSFLQENAFSTILATSQSLFNGISRQTSPFFGFFSVTHLQEFSVEDATHLLKNIAEWKHDKALVDLIQTPAGRARVRTVNHLAGGNPRVYVILSEFLTRDSLDELVEPFLKTLDELTPYYQSRISALSTQQRKIVEFFCDHAAPATVKEIAKRCFMSQQTASSQLKDLKEKGYVLPDPLGPTGRDTYYELKEPLMRLCLEVKKSRGGPIRLLIDFLRLWYPVSELRQQLDFCRPEATIERDYLRHAIQAAEETDDPRVLECHHAFHQYMDQKDFHQALAVAEELIAIEQAALDSYTKAKKLDPRNEEAWLKQIWILEQLHRPDESLKYFAKAIQRMPHNGCFWYWKGDTLAKLGHYDQALSCFDKCIEFGYGAACPYYDLAWVTMLAQNFGVGIKCLEDAFNAHPLDEKHLTTHTWFMLCALLDNAQPAQWPAQIQTLVDLYTRHDMVQAMPPALLRTVSHITGKDAPCDTVQKWYESWKAAVRNRPEFDLPLRLMDTLIRYKTTQDKRILLELPTEERKILEQMLKAIEKQPNVQDEHTQ